MNIDRGLGQLGIANAGAPHSQSASKDQAERPAFSLPAHDAAVPKRPFHRPQATASQPAEQAHAPANRTRDAARAGDDDHAVAHDDAKSTTSADGASRPARANSASRSDAQDTPDTPDTPDTRGGDDAAAPAAGTVEKPAASAGNRRAPASEDDAALPDRMLALLSGEPLPAAATPLTATVTANGLPAALALTAATGGTAAPAPADPTLPVTEMTNALRSIAPGAGTIKSANSAAVSPIPVTAGAPANTPGDDTFAALAALAGRSRDTAAPSQSTEGTPGTPVSGFAPVLARGTDALQARAAAVAAPAALPLMLNADFEDGLGARVVWMAEQRIDHAQIRVSPEALGPIDVRLQMDGHRVNAQFHAANADVRQALESGMDRLRDMLGRQGMELGQAQVGSGARQGSDGRPQSQAAGSAAAGDAAAEPQSMRVAIPRSRGLLDEYA